MRVVGINELKDSNLIYFLTFDHEDREVKLIEVTPALLDRMGFEQMPETTESGKHHA
jgi:hypothetical protein